MATGAASIPAGRALVAADKPIDENRVKIRVEHHFKMMSDGKKMRRAYLLITVAGVAHAVRSRRA